MLRTLVLLSVLALPSTGLLLATGGNTPPPPSHGFAIAPEGRTAIELVARNDQDGPAYAVYGYFTHVAGLTQRELFADPQRRDERTARFTFFGSTTATGHHVASNVIGSASHGVLTVYYNEFPAGDFAQPSSFSQGTEVATYALRHHVSLSLLGPNEGLAVVGGDLEQISSRPFRLNGKLARFGGRGRGLRLSASGRATRTQPEPPRAFTFLTGTLASVGR